MQLAGTISMGGSPEGMPNHQLISGVCLSRELDLSCVSRRGTSRNQGNIFKVFLLTCLLIVFSLFKNHNYAKNKNV